MSIPLARLGDPSSHGGTIISASITTTADGKGVARVGDLHQCPQEGHGTTALAHVGAPVLSVDGKQAIWVGDTAACGAAISAGSPTVSRG
jgi:uncharacterized Zn-binding protein involved in type VI secretion